MKSIKHLVLGFSLLFVPYLLPAQVQSLQTLISQFNWSSVSQTDSVVQIIAEQQGLTSVTPDQWPSGATYWNVMAGGNGGVSFPMPMPPQDPNTPVYLITDGIYLVDATAGQVVASQTNANPQAARVAAITAQANVVSNLINQVQEAEFERKLAELFGEDESQNPGSFVADTNTPTGLALQISSVANGQVSLNLLKATNWVYAIWTTTNLLTGWKLETELWPEDTNSYPFILPTAGRPNLFLRAEDWTEADSNNDGIPDWWLWFWFGNLNATATDLDADGNTLLYDYLMGLDPNVIQFTVQATNNYVATMSAPLQLAVTGGSPYYVGVLVDDTNFNHAVWSYYTGSNITVNLGLTQGWHDVWIGLAGFADDVTTAVWEKTGISLDFTPPKIVLTNLDVRAGSRPFIDPAGYTTKSLTSITFTVNRADGTSYQSEGLVTDQDCHPADMNHATNYFECLDVALTSGTNLISIQAMDWAGNVTVTNFSYVFDTNGDTTPPAITLTWPQDGMEVAGESFTLRGLLDDDTATVSGQYLDTNGVINTVNGLGLVERGGQFWLENLPLHPGTNIITVTATDAAGNVSTTNLTLIQSSVMLAMDFVDEAKLNQVKVDVTGTISDSTYAVWVNGVRGVNHGDGTWSATNVPVTAGGTASFDVTGYPPAFVPSCNSWTNFSVEQMAYPNPLPADPVQVSTSEDKPALVYVQQMSFSWETSWKISVNDPLNTYAASQSWTHGAGGSQGNNYSIGRIPGIVEADSAGITWPPDGGLVPTLPMHYHVSSYTNGGLALQDAGEGTPRYGSYYYYLPIAGWMSHIAGSGSYPFNWWAAPPAWADTRQYVVRLFTGGKAVREDKSLFILNDGLTWSTGDGFQGGQFDITGDVPATEITLDAQGSLEADGTLTKALPNGKDVVITPRTGKDYYFGPLPGQQKYTLTHLTKHSALTDTNRTRLNLGVGEEVVLSGMPDNTVWSASAGGLSSVNGSGSTFTAPSNAANATVTATFKGQPLQISFGVKEPSFETATTNGADAPDSFASGQQGVCMKLLITVNPTSVSFYRITAAEISCPATNIAGYMTNYSASVIYHKASGIWAGYDDNNLRQVEDHCHHAGYPKLPGGFDWVIPVAWGVGDGIPSITNGYMMRTQSFRIHDALGTSSVTKMGATTTRTP